MAASEPSNHEAGPGAEGGGSPGALGSMLKRGSLIGLGVGLTALIGVIAWQGLGTIAETIARAGWGVLWLAAYFALPMAMAVGAWALLFPPRASPPVARMVRVSWIGFGINWLLPVAQVGGEVVRAGLVIRGGSPAPAAIASVVGDKTLQFSAQIAFAALGLGLLLTRGAGGEVVAMGAVGIGVLAMLLIGFFAFQRIGLGRAATAIARRVGGAWGQSESEAPGRNGASARAREIDDAVRAVYARRGRLVGAAALRVGFRVILAGEVYIAMRLFGHPVTVGEALILESLGQSARAAAFAIPSGIGAQEGAFAVVAIALGIPPEVGVSVSLAKRVRELVVGLPALAIWQPGAARGLWRARRRAGAERR